MNNWIKDATFYHIYPLGLCGAPKHNNFHQMPEPRMNKLYGWIPHIKSLGVNALYIGPLFESTAHGYDTADYYHIDRRLGDRQSFAALCDELHTMGIKIVLDGVLNHVGRDFWAFRDVLEKGQASEYCSWFAGLDFNQRSPYNDPFSYEGWAGNYDLIKLDLKNESVKEHLFGAFEMWIREFDIDGLRLDAADVMNKGFLSELAAFCKNLKPDFWLMGEVVHGDYNDWVKPGRLDSVTNYECYKGLYSSLAEKNYFEIAWSLKRQFGEDGLYQDFLLYNFVDNHDVNRAAGQFGDPDLIYPLYCLLFTMPGVPSIYYGSEWGLAEQREQHSDDALRPCLELPHIQQNAPQSELPQTIAKLAAMRQSSEALKLGNYAELHVANEQLAFIRRWQDEEVIVILNASENETELDLHLPEVGNARFVDLLNDGDEFIAGNGTLRIDKLFPRWARVLRRT